MGGPEGQKRNNDDTEGELRRELERQKALISTLELEVERARLTREALVESEARFRSLFHDSHQVMLLVDGASGRIRDANPAACRYYGHSWSDLAAMSAAQIDAGGDGPLRDMADSGGQYFSRHILADGAKRDVEVHCSPMRLGGRVMVYAIIHDITDKKALQAEAAMSAHMASIGELAAGVAHEVNNPINGIINLAQLIIDRAGSPEATGEYPRHIIREGERISEIVRNLLSFARPGQQDPQPVTVADILDNALALMSGQLRKRGVELQDDLADDLPLVLARDRQIQQVFMNLISNAMHALEDRPGEQPRRLRISAEVIPGSGMLTVRFADNGAGLGQDQAARVFEPFFTTKAAGRGTGLGLSVSHRIVQEHGGRILFDTSEAGTTVSVELPMAEQG